MKVLVQLGWVATFESLRDGLEYLRCHRVHCKALRADWSIVRCTSVLIYTVNVVRVHQLVFEAKDGIIRGRECSGHQ